MERPHSSYEPQAGFLMECHVRCFWNVAEMDSPWKINMEHNHGGLEDHFLF